MTSRERFVRSMTFLPVDRPARTDMFCLIPEATGRHMPAEKEFAGATAKEREKLANQCAEIYAYVAERYDHDCVFVWHPFDGQPSLDVIAALRRLLGDDRAILGIVANAFWGLEQITDHIGFAVALSEDRETVDAKAAVFRDRAIERVRALADAGADVAYAPNDVAFNDGPYFAPEVYRELILPYARSVFAEVRKQGLLGVYHTDGNIMKLLDDITGMGAHCLQSIDPMAGMDIREVKRRTHGRLALMGNVQCDLLQDGPEEAIRKSARYCLTHASPGSGYIYMASNSIFEGMPLENYHVMQDEYRRFFDHS